MFKPVKHVSDFVRLRPTFSWDPVGRALLTAVDANCSRFESYFRIESDLNLEPSSLDADDVCQKDTKGSRRLALCQGQRLCRAKNRKKSRVKTFSYDFNVIKFKVRSLGKSQLTVFTLGLF